MSGKQANINWNKGASTSGVSYEKTIDGSSGMKWKFNNREKDGERRTKIQSSGLNQAEESNHGNESTPKEELRLTKKDTEDLNEAIINGDVRGVKEFIRKFPSEKFAFYNGESALSKVFRHFQDNIVKLFISKSFRLGPDEKVEVLKGCKAKAFKINLDFLTKPGCDYLTKLFLKCAITQNCQNDHQTEYFASILQALRNLKEIPEVKVLLEILASCSGLRIAFDFEHDHIGNIDPRKDENTLGCFHRSINCITIGAKFLNDPDHCDEVYGVIAHEFCHCAMEKIFNNTCKPYSEESTEEIDKFKIVIDECEKRKDKNEIISGAFNNETIKHAELIVRVPHILAAYQQNKDLLDDVKKEFRQLFDFYGDMLPFLKDEAIKVRSIDAKESANKATGVLNELKNLELRPKASVINEFKFEFDAQTIQIFQSNCIEFTIKIMYEKLTSQKKLDSFVFTNQEILDNEEVQKACVEAMNCDKGTKLIITCETIDLERIEELKETFLPWDDFIIVANEILPQSKVSGLPIHQVSHKLSDLSDDSPILKMQVDFQGTEISLNKFIKECKEIIDIYPIKNILKDSSLRVGQEIFFDKNHVNRKYESPADNKSLTYEKLMNEAKLGKVIILSDAPGNGKTTEFKYLAQKLKERFPFRWAIHIDMKKHVKSFSDQKHPHIFNSSSQLAEFFAYELLELASVEAQIFTELFISNRAVILLDGFDEVSPTFKRFLTSLVVAIKKKTKNMLWIATRPHLTSELKEKLNAKVFRMLGIEEVDWRAFFLNVFSCEGNSYPDFETTHLKITCFLSRLRLLGSFSESEVENPLFLKIIATVLFKNHESIDNYNNMYKLYKKFVNIMFEEANKKQVIDVDLDMAEFGSGDINIKGYHQKAALKILWRDYGNDDFRSLISMICDDTEQIPLEKLTRVGLMYHDGSDFFFIHKTFAEFFVAQVICDTLFSRKTFSTEKFQAAYELFKFVINNKDSEVIQIFIDMFLIDCKGNYDQFMITKSSLNIDVETFDLVYVAISKHSNLFDLISFIMIQHPKIMQKILHDLFVASFAFKILSIERIKLHFESFEVDAIKKILVSEGGDGCNCLFAAATNENKKVLEYFLNCLSKKLSDEELSTLFTVSFRFFTLQNPVFILERLKDTLNQKQLEKFVKVNFDNEVFVYDLIRYGEYDTINWFFTKFHEIVGEDHVKNILRQQTEDNEYPLKEALCDSGDKIFLLLTFFESEELKGVLLYCDSDNKNILMNCNPENFQVLYNLYEETFGIEYVKIMIVSDFKSFIKYENDWKFMNNKIESKDLFKILMELQDDPETRKFFKFCFPEIMKIFENSESPKTLNLLRKVMNSLTFDMIQKLCLRIKLNNFSFEFSDSFSELLQFLIKSFDGSLSNDEKHEIVRKDSELKEGLFALLLDAYINDYEMDYEFEYVNDDDNENINKIEVSQKIKEVFGINILKLLIPYCFNSESIWKQKGFHLNLNVLFLTMDIYLKPD